MTVISVPTPEYLRATFPVGPLTLTPEAKADLARIRDMLKWFQGSILTRMCESQGKAGTIEWMVDQRIEEAKRLAEPTGDKPIPLTLEDFGAYAAELSPEEWQVAMISLWNTRLGGMLAHEFQNRAKENGDTGLMQSAMMIEMAPPSFPLAVMIGVMHRMANLIVARSISADHPEARFDLGHYIAWRVNLGTGDVDVEIAGIRADLEAAEKSQKAEASRFGGAGKPTAN